MSLFRDMIAIVAVDSAWGIGIGGELPWHLPGDLAYFKEKTMGQIVVMGRRTFEALPGGVLSGRTNIVMTRNPVHSVSAPEDAAARGSLKIVRSVTELMEAVREIRAGNAGARAEIFVTGGAEIYRLLLPFTDRCFVTKVDTVVGADAFFPNLDSSMDFNIIEESKAMTESGLRYRFTEYVRKSEKSGRR